MANRKDDAAVEAAYLRRIQGYEVVEERNEYKVTDDGELELTKRTTATKHVPGDVRAAEFWLTHRWPRRWKPARLLGEEDGAAGGVVELPPLEESGPEPVAGDGPWEAEL